MTLPRVVIVGAGPAGVRAAEMLVDHGVRPVVVDEAIRAGGQIYRQSPDGFTRPARALYGFEATKARRLHGAFDALAPAIDYRAQTTVWNISGGYVHTQYDSVGDRIPFDSLILATGAMDRVVPFPGWTTPGVFTLGGAQVALKFQGCVVGRRTAFVGTGPLLYLVAYQYARAGAAVAAVIDSAPFAAKWWAAGKLLAGGAMFAKGLYYAAWLRARGVRVVEGAVPVEAVGGDHVTALRFRDRAGRQGKVDCDAAATGYGLKPETQLADLAGCRFAFDAASRQWLPETDADGRTTAPGVYLAGDGAGIAGADAAELRGALSALALLADQGSEVAERTQAALRRRLSRLARFRAGLDAAFPFPASLAAGLADDVLLCRCEAISAGELRAAARDLDAGEMNRAKAFTRIGMGRCQGRVCAGAAAEVLAAARGVPIEAAGRLRGQAPVKPLPLSLVEAAE